MLYLLLVLVLLLRCILEGGSISVMFPGLSMCTVRLGRRGSVSIWGCVLWKPTRCAGYSVGMRARLVRWVVSGTNILHEKWGRSTWELNSCHFFLHKVKPLSFIEGCVTWMQWVLCVHFLPWQRHALNTSPFFDSLRRFSCGVNYVHCRGYSPIPTLTLVYLASATTPQSHWCDTTVGRAACNMFSMWCFMERHSGTVPWCPYLCLQRCFSTAHRPSHCHCVTWLFLYIKGFLWS